MLQPDKRFQSPFIWPLCLRHPPPHPLLTCPPHCCTLAWWEQCSAGCLVTPPNTSTSRLVQGTTLPSIPVLQWAIAESSARVSGRSHMLNWERSPKRARVASKRSPPIEPCMEETTAAGALSYYYKKHFYFLNTKDNLCQVCIFEILMNSKLHKVNNQRVHMQLLHIHHDMFRNVYNSCWLFRSCLFWNTYVFLFWTAVAKCSSVKKSIILKKKLYFFKNAKLKC